MTGTAELWKAEDGPWHSMADATEVVREGRKGWRSFYVALREEGKEGVRSEFRPFHLAGFSPSSCYPPSLPWVPFSFPPF